MIPSHFASHVSRRLTPFLVLALLVTACGENSDLPGVDEIVDRVVAAESEVSSVHQVADMHVDMDWGEADETFGIGASEVATTTVETWISGPMMRMEWDDDAPYMAGTVMVSDGETLKMHMPGTNQAVEVAMSSIDAAAASPEQSAAQTREWATRLLQRSDVEMVDVEDVAGRPAFKLQAKPRLGSEGSDDPDATDPERGTVWIDTEYYYPLKLDMPMGRVHMRMTVREIEFNATIPPERFTLDIPDDVEAMDLPMPNIATTTADEAAEQVGFPLLALDPGTSEFELESTHVSEFPGFGDETGGLVMQSYKGPAGRIMVQQMPAMAELGDMDLASMMSGMGDAREIQIGDHDATLVSLGIAGASLYWQTDETMVTISGDLSEEDLIAFAESLR